MKVKITYPDLEEKYEDFKEVLWKSQLSLLYFYPKDNTPGCTLEAIDFSRLAEEFKKLNVQVIWVSKDSHKSHCNFLTKHSLNIALISDSDLELHKDERFLALWEKSMFGKKYLWTLRSTFLLNMNGKVLYHWNDVKAKWHANEVLDYIKTWL